MSKDLQKGSEYWSGCFNFTNIICDGKPAEVLKRDGGLKMGGTYWYYYKIDDVTDFHNVCERATTTCPLLPGQLVNVLNVPYAFSGNRSRDASTDSSSSERRTMDPNDKFENPRPAPAKPEPMRLSTSPTTMEPRGLEEVIPSNDTPNPGRFLRMPRKASVEPSNGPSTSHALAGGLRAAFKLRTARSKSPEAKQTTRVPNHRRAVSTERREFADEQRKPRARGLLLRSASEESIPTLSFEQHRRHRSPSGEARRPSDVESKNNLSHPLTIHCSNHVRTDSVTDELSKEDTIQKHSTFQIVPTRSQLDLEKRLPTLPNTPSSAYPASVIGNSPHRGLPINIEQLESHFSATTIDTEFNPLSAVVGERSHFSAWTTTTADTSSIFMDSSVPLPDDRGRVLQLQTAHCEITREGEAFLPSLDSFSSISSSISTTPSISFGDLDLDFESIDFTAKLNFDMAYDGHVPQYSLPEESYTSQATLKPAFEEPIRSVNTTPNPTAAAGFPAVYDNEIVHSESMQRLLDELSYLSDMIQH